MIDKKEKKISFELNILRSNPEIVKDGYTLLSCNLYENTALMAHLSKLKNITLKNCVYTAGTMPANVKDIDNYPKPAPNPNPPPMPEIKDDATIKYEMLKSEIGADVLKQKAMADFNLIAEKVL